VCVCVCVEQYCTYTTFLYFSTLPCQSLSSAAQRCVLLFFSAAIAIAIQNHSLCQLFLSPFQSLHAHSKFGEWCWRMVSANGVPFQSHRAFVGQPALVQHRSRVCRLTVVELQRKSSLAHCRPCQSLSAKGFLVMPCCYRVWNVMLRHAS
jgi:hypothetical protein